MRQGILASLLTLCLCACQTAEILLGPEINCGAGQGNQYQSDLRINPLNPQQMLITSKRGHNETETAVFHTLNGGTSWSVLAQLGSGDPDSVYDLNGTAHWTFIDKAGGKKTTGYRRSKDGGVTWEATRLLPADIDHLHVACDRSEVSPYRNAIYIAGRTFAPGAVIVLRSRDGGETFQPVRVTLGGSLGAGFVYSMATMPDGTLVIPVMTGNTFLADSRNHWAGTLQEIYCLRSSNGGETFDPPVRIATIDTPPDKGTGGANCLGGMAAGKFGAGHRVYLTYPLELPRQPAALFLTFSDDGGKTWARPRAIAPSVPEGFGAGSASTMVNAAGVLGVQWYAMRDEPDQRSSFELMFTASTDGGATFSTPVRVSTATSKAPLKQPRTPGQDQVYGDAAPDGSFRLVWTDCREGQTTYTNYFRTATVGAGSKAGLALEVKNGYGGGTYPAGSTVAITAEGAPAGQEFAGWTATGGVALKDAEFPIASAVVTADGSVTATYRPQTLFALTVEAGSGSGQYPVGARISISAEATPGKVFEKWMGPNEVGFLNAKAAKTQVRMPAKAIVVKASYK